MRAQITVSYKIRKTYDGCLIMSKSKIEELRHLSADELKEKATQLKKNLMQYRFQHKTNKLEKHHVLGQTRQEIARVFTELAKKKKEGV